MNEIKEDLLREEELYQTFPWLRESSLGCLRDEQVARNLFPELWKERDKMEKTNEQRK